MGIQSRLPKNNDPDVRGTLAVKSTPVELLPEESGRLGFFLCNNGNSDLYWSTMPGVSDGSVAGSLGGGLISSGGDYLSSSQLDGYTGPIWAVCPSGSTVVFVMSW